MNGRADPLISDFGAVTSIALDGAGRLYAAGGDHITVVTPWGEASYLKIPADEIFTDAAGRILTVAYRRVSVRISMETQLSLPEMGSVPYFGDAGPRDQWRFQSPTGLARDQVGNLYIADTSNGRLAGASPLTGRCRPCRRRSANRLTLASIPPTCFTSRKRKAESSTPLSRTAKLPVSSKGSGAKPFRSPSRNWLRFGGSLRR